MFNNLFKISWLVIKNGCHYNILTLLIDNIFAQWLIEYIEVNHNDSIEQYEIRVTTNI